jgi:hypothetical protein
MHVPCHIHYVYTMHTLCKHYVYICTNDQTLLDRHLISSPEQALLLSSMPFTTEDAALRELYACQLSAGAQSGARLANFAQLDAGGLGDSSDVLTAKAHYLYHKVSLHSTSAHLTYTIHTLHTQVHCRCLYAQCSSMCMYSIAK